MLRDSSLVIPFMKSFSALIIAIFVVVSLRAQLVQSGTYNFYDGLSRGLIKSIAKDNIGFMWIATDEGLIRLDGHNSTFFKDELAGGFAKGFLARPNKPLLVVHDYGVTEIISRPDTTYFRKVLSGSTIDTDQQLFFPKSLYEDRHGTLWIGELPSIVRYKDGKIRKYRFANNTDSGNIYSIYRSFSMVEDETGHLWALSFSGGLYYFDPEKDAFIDAQLEFPLNSATSFIKIKENKYWLAGKEGVFEIELAYPKVKSWRKIGTLQDISCAIRVDSEVYAGTWTKGLYKIQLNQPEAAFSKVGVLQFNDILSLAYDEHNGLWVAGSENVVSLISGFFRALPLAEPNVTIEVMGILPDSTIVVGTWQNFYFVKRNNNNFETSYSSIPLSLSPTALLCDSNRLWIGTLDGTVYYYDLTSKKLHHISEIKSTSNNISRIIKDQSGNIWICGNHPYGLIRRTKDGTLHYYKNDQLAFSETIFESSSGLLYAGGTGPNHYFYSYFPPIDSFVNISVPLDFSVRGNFNVRTIVAGKNNTFWLGTSHGLLKYYFDNEETSKHKVVRIDLGKVPIDEPIQALHYSEDEILWISTPSGLIAYDGQSALLYDQSSGLPSNNLSDHGLLFDFENNFWVGSAKGLALFQRNPSQDKRTPRPIFTALKINGINKSLTDDSSFKFSPKTNIEFSFLALSFPSNKLQYQTRLIGTDTSDWTNLHHENSLILSALAPGDYTFQVRAQQHGGFLWSEPNTFSFKIASPWYQKWWGITLFLITFFLLFFGAVRVYNWRLLQQKKWLESVVTERTKEINLKNKQIIEQNEKYRKLKEKQLREQIEYKNKQLTIYTLHLIQKNESLKELQLEINKAIRHSDRKDHGDLRHFGSLIDYSFRKDDEWEKFKLYFESVHSGFFENLLQMHPALSPQELRLCALIRLNLSIQETATILGISAESVKTARSRLRKKMDLSSQESLVDHIMKT